MELVKNLHFAKTIEEDEDEPTKEEIMAGIKQAVKEMNLIKEGKLKARPLKELLDEL